MNMTDDVSLPPVESAAPPDAPPADAPRAVTPSAKRRALVEPRVRTWWLAAAGVLVVCLYFLASRYLQWQKDTTLIRQGQLVEAYVYSADGYPIPGRRRPPTSPVELHYEVGGKQYKVQGYLTGRKESFVVHTNVPIRIDPDDPERFTAAEEPTDLYFHLTGGLLLLPFVVLLAGVALVQWVRLLGLWHTGEAVEGMVLDARHTAAAPRSWLVRCAPADQNDKRVLSAYVPEGTRRPARGDRVWLIAAARGNARAVSAGWMEGK